MKLKIPYNVKGKERQKLAQAVSEVLNTVARYQGVPSYAYEIGGCLLDRQGTLHIGSEVDGETVQRLLVYLAEQGFVGEAEGNADQAHSGFVVSLPKDSFTDKELDNLSRLAQSKGPLFGRAFGVESPMPVISGDAVSFPWFPKTTEPDEINAYTQFVDKLCGMARALKWVNAQAVEKDNDKYAFRCFLLRLGFIGDEYKMVRKTLLRNLTGDSAFRHGVKNNDEERKRIQSRSTYCYSHVNSSPKTSKSILTKQKKCGIK